MCPHDVYDWWIERYGRTLDAFWPVVDTPIGRLGIMMANEGSYPENARALAMNGAEVVYRASIPHPAASNDYFEIQNRARALDNNLYILAPNMGTYYLTADSEAPIDTFGGKLDDRRLPRPDRRARSATAACRRRSCGPINIEALRHHRAASPWTNWMKDLRTEMYQMVYEQPIYPKNLYLDRPPYTPRRVQGPRSPSARSASCTTATSGCRRRREDRPGRAPMAHSSRRAWPRGVSLVTCSDGSPRGGRNHEMSTL